MPLLFAPPQGLTICFCPSAPDAADAPLTRTTRACQVRGALCPHQRLTRPTDPLISLATNAAHTQTQRARAHYGTSARDNTPTLTAHPKPKSCPRCAPSPGRRPAGARSVRLRDWRDQWGCRRASRIDGALDAAAKPVDRRAAVLPLESHARPSFPPPPPINNNKNAAVSRRTVFVRASVTAEKASLDLAKVRPSFPFHRRRRRRRVRARALSRSLLRRPSPSAAADVRPPPPPPPPPPPRTPPKKPFIPRR